MGDTAYSCVVDSATHYCQSLVWLGTLLHRANVDPGDIHVHLTESCDDLFRETYDAIGVNTSRVQPFSDRHRHCNKIRQFETAALCRYPRVVLCDCDTAFDRNIAADFPGVLAGAKVVDLPLPPLPVLTAVLDASGIPCAPARVPTSFVRRGRSYELNGGDSDDALTLRNNCNGGIYLIDGTVWRGVGQKWAQWAEWLGQRAHLLEQWQVHLDQVSFALATWDLALEVTEIGLAYNCPLHLTGAWCDRLAAPPSVLHFHRRIDPDGRVIRTRRTVENGVVDRVNRAVERLLQDLEGTDAALSRRVECVRSNWVERRGVRSSSCP